MSAGEDPLRFPPLCDEAVLVVNDWLEQFLTDFQNHYFAQLRRAQHEAWPRHDPSNQQLSLPLPEDPPF